MTLNTQSQKDQPANSQPSDIQSVLDLGATDMKQVNACIREELASEVVLINQVSAYIINSGGKRLRPLLLVLAARACGYGKHDHIPLAAIIEFIHTATLLHDDVVDESDARRGKQAAHAVWGNSAAVLVGDFLYSRSFQMMVKLDRMRIMHILADTTNTIAEGEVLQLLNMGDPEVTQSGYLRVIDNKTAILFEAACRLAAVISNQPDALEESLASYGRSLGRAFQIADDLLDYTGDSSELGKNVGDDLSEGKPTLPLIIARERSNDQQKSLIDRAVQNPAEARLDEILEIIHSTGALESTMEKAMEEANAAMAALNCLPESQWKDSLNTLALHSVQRRS